MIGITLDSGGVADLAATLQRAAGQIRVVEFDALEDLLTDTLEIMRSEAGPASDPSSLVHVITGRLIGSFTIGGPSPVGSGTLEGRIVPGVPYAIEEIRRGGSHDYATRTVLVTRKEREAATRALARRIVALIEGRVTP